MARGSVKRPIERWKTGAAALVILVWFFANAWKGLVISFSDDDMMNLYWAWTHPWWKLLLANLTPFTTIYRPFGSLFYRVFYTVFGWHPLGFRTAAYALLLLNIWLVYRAVKLLTGSVEIAFLAAFLASYHPRLMYIYLNNGTIYDVLAFTFFFLALCVYLESGTGPERTSLRPVASLVFLALYIAGLNSKEMAAGLPLVLLAYEWIYRRRLGSRVLWIVVAITAIAFKIKSGANSFANVPDYWVHMSVHQFFATTRPLISELFFLASETLNTTKTILVFVLVWGIAIAARNKPLLFAAAFLTVTPLPINFIHPRGFFVMYLPLARWAMYFAIVLVEGRDWLWKNVWKRPPLQPGSWEPERVFLFLGLAYALFNAQSADVRHTYLHPDLSQARIRAFHDDLAAARPSLHGGARIALIHAGALAQNWTPLFVASLFYDDPTISVDRNGRRPGTHYDLVLDCEGGRCRDVTGSETVR